LAGGLNVGGGPNRRRPVSARQPHDERPDLSRSSRNRSSRAAEVPADRNSRPAAQSAHDAGRGGSLSGGSDAAQLRAGAPPRSQSELVRAGRLNTALGLILGNVMVGVSRAHHARPNDLAQDPNVNNPVSGVHARAGAFEATLGALDHPSPGRSADADLRSRVLQHAVPRRGDRAR
jgi:hypothetical protein